MGIFQAMSNDTMIPGDDVLLAQMRENNAEAFDQLFRRYWQMSFSAAYKRLQNKADAQDIVQEIFLYLWNNRAELQIQSLPAYIHMAVRNRVIKLASRQKRNTFFSDQFTEIIKNPSYIEDRLLYKEFQLAYEAFIDSLPPKRKEIYRMRHHQEMNTIEISKALGISRKSVQNQLGKANEDLKLNIAKGNIFSLVLLIFC